MNIDTKEGMAAAVAWTNHALGLLKEGGVWVVPRSGTTVLVVSHTPKQALVTSRLPDPVIQRVLRAAGWEVNHQSVKK